MDRPINNDFDVNKSSGIIVDRVQTFTISNNLIRHFSIDIQTRLATGVINQNLLTQNNAAGAAINGGSEKNPANVTLTNNRSALNLVAGVVLTPTANNFTIYNGNPLTGC